jgi:hypothetical protein
VEHALWELCTLVNGARVAGERRLETGGRLQAAPLVFLIELDEKDLLIDTGAYAGATSFP